MYGEARLGASLTEKNVQQVRWYMMSTKFYPCIIDIVRFAERAVLYFTSDWTRDDMYKNGCGSVYV